MPIYETTKANNGYIGYDYKTVIASSKDISMYLDCYKNFGWVLNNSKAGEQGYGITKLSLKRDRKIINKAELTRLQRHFEACVEQVQSLEKSKTQKATILSLAMGMLGTAFMAGSVFSVTNEPPLIFWCIVLAIPGFIGWGLAYPLFKQQLKKRTQEVTSLIEEKHEEIYDVCEKGYQLLNM